MEEAKPRVAVLLSCYNGGQYLQEQLDSLLAQTWPNLWIVARDDGSQDATREILARYAPAGVRVLPGGSRLGYPECFYELLRRTDGADYYAFCDQDDWWYPRKIERAVEMLEGRGGPRKPLACFCASEQCDEALRPRRVRRAPDEIGLAAYALNASIAPGYAMVITRELREIALPRMAGTPAHHDRFFCRAAAYLGELIPDEFIGAKHRLHEKSHTAAHMPSSGSRAERDAGVWSALRAENIDFLRRFGDLLASDARREVEAFSTAGRWRRALYPRRLRKGLGSEWRVRLRYLREKRPASPSVRDGSRSTP